MTTAATIPAAWFAKPTTICATGILVAVVPCAGHVDVTVRMAADAVVDTLKDKK